MEALPVIRIALLPSLSETEAKEMFDKLMHCLTRKIPFIRSENDVIIDMCAHIYAKRPTGEFTTIPRNLLVNVTSNKDPRKVGEVTCTFFHEIFPQSGIQCRAESNDRHLEVWTWRVEPKNPR
jgi:hypothetical protein